jgi:phytoene synthase
MSGPELSPAASLVRQLDPDLFHAALFAPEPARERLMVLYAYDIELSKAAQRASEPLIAAMRLQWWRDLVAGIGAGEPPRRHEVAEPLHGLLSSHALPADDLAALVDARETELEGPMDEQRFGAWADGRFGALTRLAAHLLAGENPAARRAASAVGNAMGVSFALRTAVALAAANQYLLPGLAPEDRAELARGRTTEHMRATAHRLAGRALALLTAARAERRAVPKAAVPALLPVWRAERVLRAARRPDFDLQGNLARRGQGGRGTTLAWRALLGRW